MNKSASKQKGKFTVVNKKQKTNMTTDPLSRSPGERSVGEKTVVKQGTEPVVTIVQGKHNYCACSNYMEAGNYADQM